MNRKNPLHRSNTAKQATRAVSGVARPSTARGGRRLTSGRGVAAPAPTSGKPPVRARKGTGQALTPVCAGRKARTTRGSSLRRKRRSMSDSFTGASALVRAAAKNFIKTPERELGDIFYLARLPLGGRILTSSIAVLPDTFAAFRRQVSEYVSVEIGWWCGDHGHDAKAVRKTVSLELFSIGRDGVLRAIRQGKTYQSIRAAKHREERRFALLDRQFTPGELLDGLTLRIHDIYGKKPALRFAVLPTRRSGRRARNP
ncbi:MAG: hypothetical protein HYZ53_21705 [Planctomycetes bacterium]|nr:hypothetical protein [Planctomycetota bacterium]